jgi:uncharacterized protein
VTPPPRERIAVLDILRGLALGGMYVVHFNYYEATPPGAEPGRAAALLEQAIALLFESRFHAIFGMLFGIGFAVMLARADARGEPFTGRFLRRVLALAAFGFIAEGIFGYNVLFGYALWALPLLLVRRWPVRALVVLLVLCAASRPLYQLTRLAAAGNEPGGVARMQAADGERFARFRALRAAKDSAEESGNFGTVVRARIAFMPVFHRQWSILPAGAFTLFLLGLIGYRLGLFDRPEEHRRLIVALAIGGAVSWALITWVFPIGQPLEQLPETRPVATAALEMAKLNAFSLLREQWLAFTYVGIVLLLVARGRVWLDRLAPLGWAGRMALTNYMSQVILLDVLFSNYGAGLEVPAWGVPVAALALLVAQIMLSKWLLSRYRLGPLEWVWRSITYWKPQPLRLD